MKILILSQEISLDQPGGSGRVAWEQSRALARAGHTVVLGVPKIKRSLKRKEKRDSVSIFRYGDPRRRMRWGRSIADIIDTPVFVKKATEGTTYDVIIVHHPHVGYGALRVRSARTIPLVYVFHASLAAEVQYEGLSRPSLSPFLSGILKPVFVRWARWVERKVLSRARVVGVFSLYSNKLLEQLYARAIKGTPVVRLPMGVDTKRFSASRSKESVRKELGINQHALAFVTVRRLVPRTGVKILIDAFRIVYDRLGDPLKLFIVGEGRERAALEQRVSSIRLRDVVVFVGRAGDEDLPRWYQAADAAVIPTIAYEGFGVSIIEAMSCGVPVIGTPVGAIPEVLRGFDERLLTDSAKPIAIADRLVWFAEEGMREHWHERTREYVKRYHSWSAHAQKVEEMLEDILERKDKQTERQAGKDKIMV